MPQQLILTLISGIFISAVAAYLGTLMLSKKMSVVAEPLAHLAFPGVALALIFGFNISLGVFPFVLIGAVFIWLLEKRTKLPMENLAAIIFALGVGTALLFLPIGEAEEALVGSITKITIWETTAVVILSLLVFYAVRKLYQKMMLMNVHEDLATIEGVNIQLYNLLYLLSIAIVVALSVYLVGGLITAALIAIPAASAKNINKGLRSYKNWAIAFGIISAIAGILIARFIHLPTGPMVIVASVALFLISVI
ncbi:ABC transporter, partial [Candidatus Kuenenbacteria bacterium RIFCSPHIGHO2_02_FULL_39_13]